MVSNGESTTFLKVFLCHSSGDKAVIRPLYERLIRDGFDAWLDDEKLIGGQDWKYEIRKAVRETDVVVVCLSNSSASKTGFIQKELKFALDVADEQPEGTIFIIPLRLEPCDVPERLSQWQWVDYFRDGGYEKLVQALGARPGSTAARSHPAGVTDHAAVGAGQVTTNGVIHENAPSSADWDKVSVLVNYDGNPQAASTEAPMTNQSKASWFFGVLFATFVLGVFVFGPPSLPAYKQQILAYICASLAGFFAGFFTGTLLLNADLPLPGKWVISGGTGFALFLIVLFWWRSPSAPIAAIQPDHGETSAAMQPDHGGAETSASNSSPPEHTPSQPVVILPSLDIPPIVAGGAPNGTKFQNRYLKKNIGCILETVKVSATEWQERNSSDSPAGCGAVLFEYTERESNDPKYFLLYDEGRNLFARIPNIPVGQTGQGDWRQLPSQTWNAGRPITRVN